MMQVTVQLVSGRVRVFEKVTKNPGFVQSTNGLMYAVESEVDPLTRRQEPTLFMTHAMESVDIKQLDEGEDKK